MSDLEEIMRKIHVLFAKCEPYGSKEENKIIVPKKEVFRLLEQLNYAIAEIQNAYECTVESRERGIKDYVRRGEDIVKSAKKEADDVYAASMVYMDDMIYELADLMTAMRQRLKDDYSRFEKRMEEQEQLLAENQMEVREQLRAMAEGEKYIRVIRRENARLERAASLRAALHGGDEYEEDAEEVYDDYDDYDEEYDEEEVDSAEAEDEEAAGEATNKSYGKSNGQKKRDGKVAPEGTEDNAERAEEDDGDSAKGAGTGKKKAGTPPMKRPSPKNRKKRRPAPNLEEEWEEERTEKKVRNIGAAVYQEVGQAYDAPTKKVSYEVRVNQAYFDQLEASVDLDAEYYQWMEEQEAAKNGEVAVTQESSQKADAKGKNRRKFGKKR